MASSETLISGQGQALVRLGAQEPAEVFAPETSYISIIVRRISLKKGRMNPAKFGPYLFGVLGQTNFDADTRLAGVFSPALEEQLMAGAGAPASTQVGAPMQPLAAGAPVQAESFRRTDRVLLVDRQLTPRLVYRGPGQMQIGFGGVLQKDYLSDTLGVLGEVVKSPVAQFVSATAPAVGLASTALDVADTVKRAFDRLADRKGMVRLAALDINLSVLFDEAGELPAGPYTLIASERVPDELGFDAETGTLVDGRGRTFDDAPHIVFELRSEPTRPDWGAVPEVNAAWRTLEDQVRAGAGKEALEVFRRSVFLSPDLVPADSQRIFEAARRKLEPLLNSPAESMALLNRLGQVGQALKSTYDELMANPVVTGARAEYARFQKCHDVMRVFEGGFVDDPVDRGGMTNHGVTQRTYDAWRRRTGQAARSVRDITEAEVRQIYFEGYWRAGRCHEMPDDASALTLFDACVNHGPGNGLRFIQRGAGLPAVAVDGAWGPQTASAVAGTDPTRLVARALDARWHFFERLMARDPSQERFRNGWRNRVEVLREITRGWQSGQESGVFGLPVLQPEHIAAPVFGGANGEGA